MTKLYFSCPECNKESVVEDTDFMKRCYVYPFCSHSCHDAFVTRVRNRMCKETQWNKKHYCSQCRSFFITGEAILSGGFINARYHCEGRHVNACSYDCGLALMSREKQMETRQRRERFNSQSNGRVGLTHGRENYD